jgi:hypothetical protein
MKVDPNLTTACSRMGYAGELHSALDSLMVEYRAIELSPNLSHDQKNQLLKCLDVTIAIMKKSLTRYANEAMMAWKLYQEELNGVQQNTQVNTPS